MKLSTVSCLGQVWLLQNTSTETHNSLSEMSVRRTDNRCPFAAMRRVINQIDNLLCKWKSKEKKRILNSLILLFGY